MVEVSTNFLFLKYPLRKKNSMETFLYRVKFDFVSISKVVWDFKRRMGLVLCICAVNLSCKPCFDFKC